MVVQVAARMHVVQAAAPDGDLGIFPFPADDRAEDLRVPAGLALGLGVSARSKHVEEAKRFLAFLARPETLRRFNAAGYNVPLDPDSEHGLPPYLKPFLPYFKRGATVPFMDQLWPNADAQQEHFAVAQDLLADKRPSTRRSSGSTTPTRASEARARASRRCGSRRRRSPLYLLVVLYPSLAGAAAAFTDWDGLGGGAQLRRARELPPPAATRAPPRRLRNTRC